MRSSGKRPNNRPTASGDCPSSTLLAISVQFWTDMNAVAEASPADFARCEEISPGSLALYDKRMQPYSWITSGMRQSPPEECEWVLMDRMRDMLDKLKQYAGLQMYDFGQLFRQLEKVYEAAEAPRAGSMTEAEYLLDKTQRRLPLLNCHFNKLIEFIERDISGCAIDCTPGSSRASLMADTDRINKIVRIAKLLAPKNQTFSEYTPYYYCSDQFPTTAGLTTHLTTSTDKVTEQTTVAVKRLLNLVGDAGTQLKEISNSTVSDLVTQFTTSAMSDATSAMTEATSAMMNNATSATTDAAMMSNAASAVSNATSAIMHNAASAVTDATSAIMHNATSAVTDATSAIMSNATSAVTDATSSMMHNATSAMTDAASAMMTNATESISSAVTEITEALTNATAANIDDLVSASTNATEGLAQYAIEAITELLSTDDAEVTSSTMSLLKENITSTFNNLTSVLVNSTTQSTNFSSFVNDVALQDDSDASLWHTPLGWSLMGLATAASVTLGVVCTAWCLMSKRRKREYQLPTNSTEEQGPTTPPTLKRIGSEATLLEENERC